MDFKEMCPIRSDRKAGFIVIVTNNKKENWYHMQSLKRLIRFVTNLKRKNINFEVYYCHNEHKMSEALLQKISNINKEQPIKRLMLDDN